MPAWVRVTLGVLAVLLLILVAVVVFGDGDHGPSRHAPMENEVPLIAGPRAATDAPSTDGPSMGVLGMPER